MTNERLLKREISAVTANNGLSNFYQHSGVLRYSDYGNWWLVVDINPELGRYYRALMPKYLGAAPQKYPTHLTVIRPERDTPTNPSAWGKYEGERIEFLYEAEIIHGKIYFWLRAPE